MMALRGSKHRLSYADVSCGDCEMLVLPIVLLHNPTIYVLERGLGGLGLQLMYEAPI